MRENLTDIELSRYMMLLGRLEQMGSDAIIKIKSKTGGDRSKPFSHCIVKNEGEFPKKRHKANVRILSKILTYGSMKPSI